MATPSFEPTRTKWYGVRTSTPSGLTANEEGAWWYRSDLYIFCYWDGSNVHCWGGVGGLLFSGDQTTVYAIGGDYAVTVTVSSPWAPATINHLIDIHFFADPTVDPGTPVNPVITGNVVGFTLVGLGAGTTLTSRVKVTGW
jgi:hypothetical protein